MQVGAGNDILIGGTIISGTTPKVVAVRGLGPSLAQFGITGFLANPNLELRDSAGSLVANNDNWQDDSTQAAQLSALGLALPDSNESGLIATLDPGSYTALMSGVSDTTGIGLLEIYDTNPDSGSELANISTRGLVGAGNNVMISGFILGQGGSPSIVIHGIGPSLAGLGIPNPLADPTLELRDNNGTLIDSNDNCGDPHPIQNGFVSACADSCTPGSLESCMNDLLPPGAYTAILAGKNGGTGIGLLEIFNLH